MIIKSRERSPQRLSQRIVQCQCGNGRRYQRPDAGATFPTSSEHHQRRQCRHGLPALGWYFIEPDQLGPLLFEHLHRYACSGRIRQRLLTVTPPVIKNPLVEAEANGHGDTVSVWAQAVSVDGGIPKVDSTPVQILPVIVVDPGLPTTNIDMTVEQVLLAQQGQGLLEILDLDVEVRHNLVSNLPKRLTPRYLLEHRFSHPTHQVASLKPRAGPLG